MVSRTNASRSDPDATPTIAQDGPQVADHGGDTVAPVGASGKIGRYSIIETLGQGGMGIVVRAYDPKLLREVALKVVRVDCMSEEARLRLLREARAMAQLSHPNVVAVYDVDDEPGVGVVVAMELVRGGTVGEWLAESRPWSEVVPRFVAAGRGLAAAHDAGLLHRDFKPSNILLGDGDRVLVTDFGLARAQDDVFVSLRDTDDSFPLVPESPATRHGEHVDHAREGLTGPLTLHGAVLGTVAYMAPEQHDGRALTPAADQYALCVSLWQALTGSLPFKGTLAEVGEAKRRGPPSWPSSTDVPADIVGAIVRGLAPEPEARWPSLHELLEVLAAERPNWLHRSIVGLALVGTVGAVVATRGEAQPAVEPCSAAPQLIAESWTPGRRRAVVDAMMATELVYAPAAAESVAGKMDAFASSWVDMHTEACRATRVRGDQSELALDLRIACLDRAKQGLDAVVSTLLEATPDTVRRSHQIEEGLPSIARCADLEALQAEGDPPPPSEADGVAAIEAELAQAKIRRLAGDAATALAAVDRAEQLAADLEYEPVRARVALERGLTFEALGRYEPSEASLRLAVREATRLELWDVATLAVNKLMFVVGFHHSRHDEALGLADIALGLARRDPRSEVSLRNDLSTVLRAKGDYAAAEAELRRVLELDLELDGPESLSVASARNNLSAVLAGLGRLDEAEAEQRASLAGLLAAAGADHPEIPTRRLNYAISLTELGRLDEAEAQLRDALEGMNRIFGPDYRYIATARAALATVLAAKGQLDAASVTLRSAIEQLESTVGERHVEVGMYRANLGILLLQRGEPAQAERELTSALATFEDVVGPEHPNVAYAALALGQAIEAAGRPADALPQLERAWVIRRDHEGSDGRRAEAALNLARVLAATGDETRARGLVERARELAERGGDQARVDEAQAWLDAH